MADIKISELAETTDLESLYTIGTDKNNLSKKVSLQFVKEAAEYAIEQGNYAKQQGSTIDSRITELTAETNTKLAELSAEIFIGKRVSIVGDSISTYLGVSSGTNSYYPTADVTSVERTWWHKFVAKTGATLQQNVSQTGAWIAEGDTLHESLIVKVGQIEQVDIVVLAGGQNDVWNNVPIGQIDLMKDTSALDDTKFSDAYIHYVRSALEKAIEKVICVITNEIPQDYADVIKAVANYYDCICVDLTQQYVSKVTKGHPDYQGMMMMAESVISAITSSINPKLTDIIGQYEDNAEYLKVYTDGEGKFLWGIKSDGSIEWAKGTPTPVREYIEKAITDGRPALLDMMSVQPSENYEMNHEVVLDAEEKLLSWRDMDGVKHETKMQIENDLRLSKSAMSKFIQSLIASGFTTETPIDHSNKDSIALPTPRYCAVVNIISPLGLATSKTQDIQCELEYLDKSGNYFKKPVILNAQGTSSMSYIEKNQSIDIFNDEAREESCEITFDNWVAQDSFHLKCYYIDVFRGVCNMAYKWAEEVIKATDSRNNRVKWNRNDITEYNSTGDFAADFSDSALCHPDGFPFEMYVNGEYYGLYVWNIKKHRKNYSMKKSNYKELLLDGLIDNTTFFSGSINWSEIELRNPKTLITMSGAEYDGENPLELIDSTSAAYSAANKDHVNTAITKAEMQRIANALPLIRAASEEQAKALFESHFDVKALMRYFIISNTLHHYDGFAKNWIWTIYDGIAAPTEYDMDSIFGRDYRGLLVVSNSTTKILGAEEETITGQLIRLYKDELDAMYKDLRDKDILSVKNIMRYVLSWCESATYAAIQRNLEKWTSIPSYRASKNMNDGTQDGGMYDSPYRIEKWLTARIETLDNYFNLR